MYLYLGGDKAVAHRDLIGIFDLDTTTVQKHSRDFLAQAQKQDLVHNAGNDLDLPKSFVLTNGGVCLSPHNSQTLQKRLTTRR